MDMLPPQAPPAHTSSVDQASVDTVQRMAAAQHWILEQQNALPDPPLDTDKRECFLADIDAFWRAEVLDTSSPRPLPRQTALAARLAHIARDDAALRAADGTLSRAASELIARVARATDEIAASGVQVGELFAGDAPYAGSLILSDDQQPGMFLLFTTRAGWRAFPSIDRLLVESEPQLRRELAASDGTPWLDTTDVEWAMDGHLLSVQPVHGRPFDAMAERIVTRFRQTVAHAWDAHSDDDRVDALHDALNLHAFVDLHAIVAQRDAALLRHLDDTRLASLPAFIADAWRTAARQYQATLRRVAWTRQTATLAAPMSLAAFAHHERMASTANPSPPSSTTRLAERYVAYLDTLGGTTADATAYRTLSTGLLASRMRFEAADARLGYYDDGLRHRFIDDHSERGFAWVQAILDHPAATGRPTVERHELVVYQLTHHGQALTDLFLIGSRQPRAVPRVILYTPDAPDGLAFREFSDRDELRRTFLDHPAFAEYLATRLAMGETRADAHGRRVYAEREVSASFLDAAYDTSVDLARRHARYVAAHPGDADGARLSLAPLRLPGETLAAPPNRERTQLASLVSSAIASHRVTRSIGSGPASALARAFRIRATLPRGDTLFQERFLAKGIVAPKGTDPLDGILTLNDGHYIRQGQALYHVRFDNHLRSWRLKNPNALDAHFSGPLIRRLPDGQWGYRSTGLRGGMGDTPDFLPSLLDRWDDLRPYLAAELGDFSAAEFLFLRHRLTDELGTLSAMRVIHENALRRLPDAPPTTLTALETERWSEALAAIRGRRTPPPSPSAPPLTPPAVMTVPSLPPIPPEAMALPEELMGSFRQMASADMIGMSAAEIVMVRARLTHDLGNFNAVRVFDAMAYRQGPGSPAGRPLPSYRQPWRDAIAYVRSRRGREGHGLPEDIYRRFADVSSPDLADFALMDYIMLQARLNVSLGFIEGGRLFRKMGYRGQPIADVSSAHRAIWQENVAHVREHRSIYATVPIIPSVQSTVTAGTTGPATSVVHTTTRTTAPTPMPPPRRAQLVPDDELPEVAYYYASRSELAPWRDTGSVMLPQARLLQGEASGIPLLTWVPETPLANVPGAPGGWVPATGPGAGLPTLGSATGAWVRLSLRDVVRSANGTRTALRVYRPMTGEGHTLLLRPTPQEGAPGITATASIMLSDHFSLHFAQP